MLVVLFHSRDTINYKYLDLIKKNHQRKFRPESKLSTKELFLFEIVMINSGEEFEDTNGIIWFCISKDRQHNGQKKKIKQDLQKTTQKNKNRAKLTNWMSTGFKEHQFHTSDSVLWGSTHIYIIHVYTKISRLISKRCSLPQRKFITYIWKDVFKFITYIWKDVFKFFGKPKKKFLNLKIF